MSEKDTEVVQSFPISPEAAELYSKLTFKVASSIEIGSLAVGVALVGEAFFMDVVEVVETDEGKVGKYNDEAAAPFRVIQEDGSHTRHNPQSMLSLFLEACKKNEFDFGLSLENEN